MTLLTGRGSAAQWHTQTRTRNSDVLRKLAPLEAYAEINPSDAAAVGVRTDDRIHIASQRGHMLATAYVTHAVQPGHVFIPMHYPAVNRLTHSAFDPYSQQPAYKSCAVRVTRPSP